MPSYNAQATPYTFINNQLHKRFCDARQFVFEMAAALPMQIDTTNFNVDPLLNESNVQSTH